VIIALGFDFTNGFHDAANAIATSIGTRALTPRVALLLAAAMNLLGATLGTGIAKTVGGGIIGATKGTSGLAVRRPRRRHRLEPLPHGTAIGSQKAGTGGARRR